MNIKDIAAYAGVAVSTVSRVINNHPDVSEDTRKKILTIIDEHGYIPNNSARNLKRTVSNNIGVLVKGIYNPFFAKIVQKIGEEINERGYSMILHYNHGDISDFDIASELIKEKKLRGLISLGGEFGESIEEKLAELEVPIIIVSAKISKNIDKSLFSSISIENEQAAFEAVDYLCSLGHRKIGIISPGYDDKSIGTLRYEGYKKALEHNQIEYNRQYLEIGRYTFESGFEAMERLLEKDLSLTAVFVISDIMAIGAAKAIMSRGMKIPEDISIIGFDGIDYTQFFHPSITTVDQPEESMAKQSVDLLYKLINNKCEHQHIVLNTKLLKRESCRCIFTE